MHLPSDELRAWSAAYGITLTDRELELFEKYADFLVEYNAKVNLTAITQPQEIAEKHFLDSLLLLAAVQPEKGARIIDVGTGAGFPGVPVKIVRPDMQLTLLDSLNKRLVFLGQLAQKLGLEWQEVHARAEEAGRQNVYRENFDIATARAVAPLSVLCEYCLPFVRIGGIFIALKSRGAQTEIGDANRAISLLGGKLREVRTYTLPQQGERSLIIVEKISQTSSKYPRPSAKMAKSPL